MNSSYIEQLTVESNCQYIVYGSVRGLVSEHRKVEAALRSARRDQAGCASQGGYSDAYVYRWDASEGWAVVDTYEIETA